MMFKRFKSSLDFSDFSFYSLAHFLNITFHCAILGISRLNATSFSFSMYSRFSLSGTIGIELACVNIDAIFVAVLYLLKLVFFLQFHDSVSRREVVLIHGNRFH